MKTFETHITRLPEGMERDATPVGLSETSQEIMEVLELPELKARPRNLDYAEVRTALVEQLREYAERAKITSLVIGISGGVDSGLVSTLCAETGLKVVCVEIPIEGDNETAEAKAKKEEIKKRVQKHLSGLKASYPNVESFQIDLTETFETLKKALPQIENEEVVRYMAYVNTQSRLRGVTLYALANEKNGIVVGTGNKVEDYGIGFFTKYGDGAVDVSPIGGLLKSEVRALARHMGVLPLISEAIATDGLHSNGATDETQIGATYDELEWAMQEYDEGKREKDFLRAQEVMEIYVRLKAPQFEDILNIFNTDKDVQEYITIAEIDEIVGQKKSPLYFKRAAEVMKIYTKRHEANAHKMAMPPVFQFLIPEKGPEYYGVHQ